MSAAHVDTVVACDDGRFGLKTWRRRRWCVRSARPPWVVQEADEGLWLDVAVEPTQGRVVCWVVPGVDSACFTAFLAALRAAWLDERVGLVRDNAPSHRSGRVQWPDGVVPLPVPPYRPELNPAEQIFRHLRKRLANQIFDDLPALHAALTQAVAELWEQPQVVVRLTAYPWWAKGMQANMPLIS